jgi:hypothetical protein
MWRPGSPQPSPLSSRRVTPTTGGASSRRYGRPPVGLWILLESLISGGSETSSAEDGTVLSAPKQGSSHSHVARSLALFSVRRADIETFARDLEVGGRVRATFTCRLCTITPVLQVPGWGRTPGGLPGRPCPAGWGRPRVARRRAGPHRARRDPRCRRTRPARRARPDLPARLNGLRVSEASGSARQVQDGVGVLCGPA